MSQDEQLHLLGSETFHPSEFYRVVTFLNQCLKQQGYVFGLTRSGDSYSLKIYQGQPDVPTEVSTDSPTAP